MGSWLEDWDKILEESKKYTKSGTLKKTTEPKAPNVNKGLTEEDKRNKRLQTESYNNPSYQEGISDEGEPIAIYEDKTMIPLISEIRKFAYKGSEKAQLDSLSYAREYGDLSMLPKSEWVRPQTQKMLITKINNLSKKLNEYREEIDSETDDEGLVVKKTVYKKQYADGGKLESIRKIEEAELQTLLDNLSFINDLANRPEPKNNNQQNINQQNINQQNVNQQNVNNVEPETKRIKLEGSRRNPFSPMGTKTNKAIKLKKDLFNKSIFKEDYLKNKGKYKSVNDYKNAMIKNFLTNVQWKDSDGNLQKGFKFERNNPIIEYSGDVEKMEEILKNVEKDFYVGVVVDFNGEKRRFKGPFLGHLNPDNWEIVEGGDKPKENEDDRDLKNEWRDMSKKEKDNLGVSTFGEFKEMAMRNAE